LDKTLPSNPLFEHAWEEETLSANQQSLCLISELNEDKKRVSLIRLSQTASND
jgi:predicted HAD superfamily hydrolase